MPNLAIVGYGKMGRLIDQLAPEYGFTVTARLDVDREESLDGVDAAVEFSVPSAVIGNIQKVSALRIPIVIGTTAWLDHLAAATSTKLLRSFVQCPFPAACVSLPLLFGASPLPLGVLFIFCLPALLVFRLTGVAVVKWNGVATVLAWISE